VELPESKTGLLRDYVGNETQFCFSIQALGFRVSAAFEVDRWLNQYLRTFEGYEAVSQAINSVDRCEPKADPFPFKSTLCRRWWTSEHQRTCGGVTDQAIKVALNYGSKRTTN